MLVPQALCPLRELARGAAPPERVDVAKERRVRPERREIPEEESQVAVGPENALRKVFDRAMPVQEPCGADPADSPNAGVSVRGVTDEREKIGNEDGLHSELLAYSFRVANLLAAAVHLHDARAADALRQVLVRRPDADFLDL